MTLIRVKVKDGTEPYNQKQGVINASQVVMYEESNELWWATQEHHKSDMDKVKNRDTKGYAYLEHAKTSTRVFLTSGQVKVVCQSFESFDRAFTSMTSR
tara:strand:+ start:620 stop:916 length:297 start_codon:yes stop_codon:yes gene_type:complete